MRDAALSSATAAAAQRDALCCSACSACSSCSSRRCAPPLACAAISEAALVLRGPAAAWLGLGLGLG